MKLKIEKRLRAHHMAIIERNTKYTTNQLDRISGEMKAALLKTIAYKEVISRRTFSKITDRQERLNSKYTQYALRFEIADQLQKLEPVFIREQKARNEIDKQRNVTDKIIKRNLRSIASPRAAERKRLLKELNLDHGSTFTSEISVTPTPVQTIISRQNTQGLVVTKESIQSKGKLSPLTIKLPVINTHSARSGGKPRKPADDSVVKQQGARLKLPPIKLNTVR